MDATTPVGAAPRDGRTLQDVDIQKDGSFIAANWDEFQDPESGVTKYEWCAGTRTGVCDIISKIDIGVLTVVGQQIIPPVASGIKIFVTLSAYNGAGGATTVYSDGVLVDETPPEVNKVTIYFPPYFTGDSHSERFYLHLLVHCTFHFLCQVRKLRAEDGSTI